MLQIDFSIIIPAYNEEKMISRTFPEILRLNYDKEKLEYILIDNGSTDHTIEMAKSFGFKVKVVPDITIAEMRNMGAQISTGKYLAFLDADSIPDPEWLNRASFLLKDEKTGAYGTIPSPPNENATWVEKYWFLLTSTAGIQSIRKVPWLSTFNLIVKRDYFINVGGFNTELITCEDSDLGYKLQNVCDIILDVEISTIHLRDSKTIKEFIKKEFWRGKGNYQSFINHNLSFSEIPSLILPAIFFALIFFLPLSLIIPGASGNQVILSIIFIVISMPMLMLIKKKVPVKYFFLMKGPYILCFLYLLVRGASIFASIRGKTQ